jgi:hypothetical protein
MRNDKVYVNRSLISDMLAHPVFDAHDDWTYIREHVNDVPDDNTE